MPNKIPILCGDIGGTKSHLCLMRITSNPKDHHDIIDSTYHFHLTLKTYQTYYHNIYPHLYQPQITQSLQYFQFQDQ